MHCERTKSCLLSFCHSAYLCKTGVNLSLVLPVFYLCRPRLSLVFCHGEDAVSLLNLYSHIAYTRQNLAFHVVAHAYL